MSEPNVNAIPSPRTIKSSRTHKLTVTAMLSGRRLPADVHRVPHPGADPLPS